MSAVEAVAARLAGRVDGWEVFEHGVPDGALPQRYIVVWGSQGAEESTRACDTVSVIEPVVWVTSVCRYNDSRFAAKEATGSSGRVRAALRNHRPEDRWAFRSVASSPARRDESLPETTQYAVEQFALRRSL